MKTLPLKYCAEYDAAAKWCAERKLEGAAGDPLPENMGSPGAIDYIQADPEAFEKRVREFAYGIAMESATHSTAPETAAHTPDIWFAVESPPTLNVNALIGWVGDYAILSTSPRPRSVQHNAKAYAERIIRAVNADNATELARLREQEARVATLREALKAMVSEANARNCGLKIADDALDSNAGRELLAEVERMRLKAADREEWQDVAGNVAKQRDDLLVEVERLRGALKYQNDLRQEWQDKVVELRASEAWLRQLLAEAVPMANYTDTGVCRRAAWLNEVSAALANGGAK